MQGVRRAAPRRAPQPPSMPRSAERWLRTAPATPRSRRLRPRCALHHPAPCRLAASNLSLCFVPFSGAPPQRVMFCPTLDVYHMQSEEVHIGEAVRAAGARLINLHLADSNRSALGEGSFDVDTLIMALYLIGYNQEGRFVTPEPLGPGGDPYPAMNGRPNPSALEHLVQQTARYFREREQALLE